MEHWLEREGLQENYRAIRIQPQPLIFLPFHFVVSALFLQRPLYVISCVWDCAYKTSPVVAAGFLSDYISFFVKTVRRIV